MSSCVIYESPNNQTGNKQLSQASGHNNNNNNNKQKTSYQLLQHKAGFRLENNLQAQLTNKYEHFHVYKQRLENICPNFKL